LVQMGQFFTPRASRRAASGFFSTLMPLIRASSIT
jgi:hypothetical protein